MHAATLCSRWKQALRVSPLYDDRGQQVAHMQWPQLLGCGTRIPLYLIGDAASHRGLSRVGYFIPPNGPLNGHPPGTNLSVCFQEVCLWCVKSLIVFQLRRLEQLEDIVSEQDLGVAALREKLQAARQETMEWKYKYEDSVRLSAEDRER